MDKRSNTEIYKEDGQDIKVLRKGMVMSKIQLYE
jgi:hypothetical protein